MRAEALSRTRGYWSGSLIEAEHSPNVLAWSLRALLSLLMLITLVDVATAHAGSGNYKGLRSRNRLQSGVGLRLVKERQENGNELDRLFRVANVIDSLDFRRDLLFPDPFGSVDSFVIGQWTAQPKLYFEDMPHWHLSDSWITARISQFQPDYFLAPGVATSILASNLVLHNGNTNKPVYGTIAATTVAHVLDLKLNYYHVAQGFGVFYASGSGIALLDHISNSRVQLLSARSRDTGK